MTIEQLIDELATVGAVVGLNAEVRAWYIGAEPTPLEVGRAVPSPPCGVCGVEQATEPQRSRCPEYDRHSCLSRPSAAICPQIDGQECPSYFQQPTQRACAAPLLPLDVLRTVSVLAGFDRVTQCSTGVIQIKP